MPVLAGAEPFSHTGSTEVGVLLCHGFTGTPASLRPWGEHLADAGFTVRWPPLIFDRGVEFVRSALRSRAGEPT